MTTRRSDLAAAADRTYAELRREGTVTLPLEARGSDRDFERYLSLLRYRARKDGYRVYTWRGTRTRPLMMWQRSFELHHGHDRSKPAYDQPRGVARPDQTTEHDPR
jgi:hypothetical protein